MSKRSLELTTKKKSRTHKKATSLHLCRCNFVHIRTFHVTWISFFVCFFAWFGVVSLYNQYVVHTLGLNDKLISQANTFARGNSISALATLIFRIVFGFLCDFMGPRYSYLIVIVIGILSQVAMIFIQTKLDYTIIQFFVGIIGASFVITEYHMTTMFDSNCIGLVMGTAAGWGNLGGGVTQIITPLFAKYITANNWKASLTLPISLLAFIAFPGYYYVAKDTPKGNLYKNIFEPFNRNNFKETCIKFRKTTFNYRTWIAFFCYAACFGMEVLILRYTSRYLVYQFDITQETAASIVLVFSSLNIFARSLGGYASDTINIKFGIQGRVYTLFMCLLCSSVFMLLYSSGHFDIGYTILMLIFLSVYIQAAEGVCMAIGPYIVDKDSIGCVFGYIGAGGNFGVMLFSLTLFEFVPNDVTYQFAFTILALFIFIVGISTLLVKFSKSEVKIEENKLKEIQVKGDIFANSPQNTPKTELTDNIGFNPILESPEAQVASNSVPVTPANISLQIM